MKTSFYVGTAALGCPPGAARLAGTRVGPIMKAAILASPKPVSQRPLRIAEIADPQLKPGYVLLRVRACGVCRTDLHIVEGELPAKQTDMIPGHQIVGEVVAGATQEVPLGSRVGVSWLGATLPRSLVTTYPADTRNMLWLAPTLCLRCPRRLTT